MMRELKTLVAVAREGTFAAAGERVGLTQAAVSAQMQRLESGLGFSLFDRSGRTARLNVRGHQTLKQAQEILRLCDNLGSEDDGKIARVLTIGAIASVQRGHLPEVLAKVHRIFETARSRVIPGVSMQLLDLVDAGELDIAAIIRPPFSMQSDLRWTALAREPFRLLVPRDVKGNDWADLISQQPFVRYDRTSFGGRQVDRFLRTAHLTVNEVCELDELDAIVRLVAAGLGVALVPETSTQRRWPAAVRAIDLGTQTFHRDIGLVHRSPHELSEPAKLLIQLLGSEYGRARPPMSVKHEAPTSST
jgi:DNA-binding transcriptional LysR family regulator